MPQKPSEAESESSSLLSAARRDALAFDLLAAQQNAPSEVVFFLAQQSIEKSMKAVLAHRKVAYPKTHDLLQLSALLSDDLLLEKVSTDLMIRLGPYAVELRYVPPSSPRVYLDEVQAAITQVLAWVEQSLES